MPQQGNHVWRDRVILTCEHATNHVPPRYAALFDSDHARSALQSHRGYDIGAKNVALALARAWNVPLICGNITRLAIDLNRSENHRAVFSEFTKTASHEMREALRVDFHQAHWNNVITRIEEMHTKYRQVIHIAVHSFTPELDGVVRDADIGLLYDPSRKEERALTMAWKKSIDPKWRVRCNYPYRGATDGFPTALRKRWPASRYVGIELEINQRVVSDLSVVEDLATLHWPRF